MEIPGRRGPGANLRTAHGNREETGSSAAAGHKYKEPRGREKEKGWFPFLIFCKRAGLGLWWVCKGVSTVLQHFPEMLKRGTHFCLG